MPSNYSTFTVSFRGQVDVALRQGPKPDDEPDSPEPLADRMTKVFVDDLSRDDSVSEQVETELGRMLPPGVSARVQLSFSKGSVVVAGLLTLFAWATPIVATKA